ncbi:cupin domain-containing protein [Chryseobacterium sp.]|uniref:cupin domain-containing protein n=1 Tax=Chryseobacterium sp. TaxID=1871047 RepID=UPI001E35C437|nr:cupin domain-containing protein [Chryseobacterium sp.]
MPAGTREQLHFHTEAQQFFYVLKGTATFYSDGQTTTVGEHQGILIHPKTPHYIANETAGVLEFLVISQPSTNADRTELDASQEPSAAV